MLIVHMHVYSLILVGPQIPRHLQLRPHKVRKMATVTVYPAGKPLKLRGICEGYFKRLGPEGWADWHSKSNFCRFVEEWRGGQRYWGHWSYPNGVTFLGFYVDGHRHGKGEWWNAEGNKCKVGKDGYLHLLEAVV
jgi:hypothetical protein